MNNYKSSQYVFGIVLCIEKIQCYTVCFSSVYSRVQWCQICFFIFSSKLRHFIHNNRVNTIWNTCKNTVRSVGDRANNSIVVEQLKEISAHFNEGAIFSTVIPIFVDIFVLQPPAYSPTWRLHIENQGSSANAKLLTIPKPRPQGWHFRLTPVRLCHYKCACIVSSQTQKPAPKQLYSLNSARIHAAFDITIAWRFWRNHDISSSLLLNRLWCYCISCLHRIYMQPRL